MEQYKQEFIEFMVFIVKCYCNIIVNIWWISGSNERL